MTSVPATITLFVLLWAVWWLYERTWGNAAIATIPNGHHAVATEAFPSWMVIETDQDPASGAAAVVLRQLVERLAVASLAAGAAEPANARSVRMSIATRSGTTVAHCQVPRDGREDILDAYYGPVQLPVETSRSTPRQFACLMFLASVDSETAVLPAGSGLLDRVTEVLIPQNARERDFADLITLCRTHIALCQKNWPALTEAYAALKARAAPTLEPWAACVLRQEALLSLAVAEREQRPAPAYRGLECLRRLRRSSGPEILLDRIERRLRPIVEPLAQSPQRMPGTATGNLEIARTGKAGPTSSPG